MGGETRPGQDLEFPSTHWSELLEPCAERRREVLENLAIAYWRPIRAYIRFRWARSDQDAHDLTQDFFVWVIETDFLSRACPEQGRFRGFVKAALNHYLCDDERRRQTLKRGGGRTILRLGDAADGGRGQAPAGQIPDQASKTPDEILDEEWKRELLERGCAILEERYLSGGKAVRFEVFRDYCLSPEPETDYQRLASKYGLRVGDVSNCLRDTRKRFRDILRDLIAETVSDPRELSAEYEALFGRAP